MTEQQEPQAEIVINRSSSREGGVGWSIRLVRRVAIFLPESTDTSISHVVPDETDADYTARVLAKHRELEQQLLSRVCCHDADRCQEIVKEASRE